MAGFVFGIDSIDSLEYCIKNGIYSTKLSVPEKNNWRIHHEGTFADYLSMKPGDNVYFFIDRKVYGIGELISVGQECKYQNYPGALEPINFVYKTTKAKMLINQNESNINNRVICTFKPYPHFL